MKLLIILLLYLIACVSDIHAQEQERTHQVASDSFSELAFNESSVGLTPEGIEQLRKFSRWYLSTSKDGLYHVYLSGLVTESELQKDSFIGVKRCKVILDSLVNNGVDISLFFITRDKLQKHVGVGLIVDSNKRVMLESTNEDEYFRDNNKKNRKKK